MSGDQEPWVFRGGLTADLQRLIPIDNGNDLLAYRPPTSPTSELYTIRPYIESDTDQVNTNKIWKMIDFQYIKKIKLITFNST